MKLGQGVLWRRTTGVVLVVLCIWQLSSFPVSAMESTSLADVIERVKPVVVNISVGGGNAAPAVADPERFFDGDQSFEDFFRKFFRRQSFVSIEDDRPATRAMGSGFIVDPSGLVVTNNHVVAGATDVIVTLNDGTQLSAEVVGFDQKTDLSLLQVDTDHQLPSAIFGDSDLTRVGDRVFAVGNPFGLQGTVTTGIVSARGRDIQSGPFDDFLQIDAPINQGNSGGPLFDVTGKVIGVNTAIFSPNGGNVGIGFAIPSGQARPVIEQLRAQGYVDRGWLGVQIQSLDEDIAVGLGLAGMVGALVTDVLVDSPAEVAGIESGDVVTTFDGRPIKNIRDLTLAVASSGSEQAVELGVQRGAEFKNITVWLGNSPGNEALLGSREKVAKGPDNTLGLSLALLPAEVRRRFQIQDTMTGVLVVGAGGVPSGLSRGDVILRVGNEPVENPSDVNKLIATARENGQSTVVFYVARSSGRRFIAVPFP